MLSTDRSRVAALEVEVRRLIQGQAPRQLPGGSAGGGGGGGAGVTDHGALTGLADNDHPHYTQLDAVIAAEVLL